MKIYNLKIYSLILLKYTLWEKNPQNYKNIPESEWNIPKSLCKIPNKYICLLCNYNTNKLGDYKKHEKSNKHIKNKIIYI